MYSASEVAHFYSSAYAQAHLNKINLLKNVFDRITGQIFVFNS